MSRRAGFFHSAETRAKISVAHKGRNGPRHSLETRLKMSATRKGRKFSPEHCAALSRSNQTRMTYTGLSRTAQHRRTTLAKYGLTEVSFALAFQTQGECCAICKRKEPVGKYWHTDHDHTTSRFRGILCMNCNHLIGLAHDDPAILRRAAEYVCLR